jgi:putative two-component system response regulator
VKTIFIVDDNKTNLMAAKNALDGTYRTFALTGAARMLTLAERITPDLILLDINMPEIDGFEALALIKNNARLKSVPVIFLTGQNDAETEIRGFEMGALDFIIKPFSPPVLLKRLESHLYTDLLIKESQTALRELHNATISVIADMVENRDKITGGHIERTQVYLRLLVDELVRAGLYLDEIKSWDMTLLLPSAQLHDVGKIVISDIILNKPSGLTEAEFAIIMTHCTEGERIIDHIITMTKDDGFLNYAKRFAGYHHERWDGSGYPRGLTGLNIPLEGRILAVADVYDALRSDRPYKRAFTHKEAVQIIAEDSGSHFDPVLVEAFLHVEGAFKFESERTRRLR